MTTILDKALEMKTDAERLDWLNSLSEEDRTALISNTHECVKNFTKTMESLAKYWREVYIPAIVEFVEAAKSMSKAFKDVDLTGSEK